MSAAVTFGVRVASNTALFHRFSLLDSVMKLPGRVPFSSVFSFSDRVPALSGFSSRALVTSSPFHQQQMFFNEQQIIDDCTVENPREITNAVIEKVEHQIQSRTTGRLFAIVHVLGKQYRLSENDLFVVRGSWSPDIGDQIKLEKVLLVGGCDFTLIGRPLLRPGLVRVEATVVEKALSNIRTSMRFARRKDSKTYLFHRTLLTTMRVNRVSIEGAVNDAATEISASQS